MKVNTSMFKQYQSSSNEFLSAPGAVENLEVKNIGSHDVTLTFDPPSENEQCVAEYIIHYVDVNSTGSSMIENEMKKVSVLFSK